MLQLLVRTCVIAGAILAGVVVLTGPVVTASDATCQCGPECQCGENCQCHLIVELAMADVEAESPQALTSDEMEALTTNHWALKIAVRRAVRLHLPSGTPLRDRLAAYRAVGNKDDLDTIVAWLEAKHGKRLAAAYAGVQGGDGTIIRAIVDAIKELLPVILAFIKELLPLLVSEPGLAPPSTSVAFGLADAAT